MQQHTPFVDLRSLSTYVHRCFSGVPLQVEEGTFRVEFPDIFRTLILNREIMPGGRGKRLRVRGDFTGIVANIQANQASCLYLYHEHWGYFPALWRWTDVSMRRVRTKGNACSKFVV